MFEENEEMQETAKELLALMSQHNLAGLRLRALGSGDEGEIYYAGVRFRGQADFEDAGNIEATDEVRESLYDLGEQLIEQTGFDYYNNEGGDIALDVDAASRKVEWTTYVNTSVASPENDGVMEFEA